MKEIAEIVKGAEEAERAGKPALLATVVRVEGSVYRRPGARMLLTEEGWQSGSISGGCLETDLADRAWRLTEAGEPTVVRYNTQDDGDALFGTGVGCRGVVDVLLERLTPGSPLDPVAFLRDCHRGPRAGTLATIIGLVGETWARVGARLALRSDGSVKTDIRDRELAARIEADARRARIGDRASARRYPLLGGEAAVLLEVIGPPLSLVLFGAGHDAIPIARLAGLLGWRVAVVDHRPGYVTAARFPSADARLCALPEAVCERVRLDGSAAALVMTHNYLQDLRLLKLLAGRPLRYLGVLGPRSRTERLLLDLESEGVPWTAERRARLFAPAGLDIGGEGPEGIALAILAEIQAVLSDRAGGFLRARPGPIHAESGADPLIAGGESWVESQATCGLSAS